ncbi:hypothetical protein DHEL01_v201292 [Diaporthe helianthi]|uniref:Protein kinase domain-containing protein n=1 Tax=Diaporthe helianthi TaxID=158607 RepID=A0A2P5ICT9_DIAHE|nr:hypothetical protein DHEL01_v201292 [Diaporthe helianthi]
MYTVELEPGVWTVLAQTSDGSAKKLLDVCIQPRKYWIPASTATDGDAQSTAAGRKRRARQEQIAVAVDVEVAGVGAVAGPASIYKKRRAAGGEGRHKHRQGHTDTQPLLTMSDGETVHLRGQDNEDCYSLTRCRLLTSTRSASLYTAKISRRPGQVVVIKTIKLRALSAINQWQREVRVYKEVGHQPHIAHLIGSDARTLSLQLEYIDSPSLEKHLDEKYMCTNPDMAFLVLSDITAALQFLHDSSIVHNDVKPANIIYHQFRGAMLIDFGLAGTLAESHGGGTPWYLPPENQLDEKNYPPRDIFALGVTLLWVLGKCPLPEKSCAEWTIAHLFPRAGVSNHVRSRTLNVMNQWLAKVMQIQAQLSTSAQSIESVVFNMVDRKKRSTAAAVLTALKSVKTE